MSKAILVIDMPRDCPMCPVAHYNKLDEFTGCDVVAGKRYAMTTEEGYAETTTKPSWCPLKPMPKKIIETENNKTYWDCPEFYNGWNCCIDEILGEEE